MTEAKIKSEVEVRKKPNKVNMPDKRIVSLPSGSNTPDNLLYVFDYELSQIAKGNYENIPMNITNEDRKLGNKHLKEMAEKHLTAHIKDIIATGYLDMLVFYLIDGAEAKHQLYKLKEAVNSINEVLE